MVSLKEIRECQRIATDITFDTTLRQIVHRYEHPNHFAASESGGSWPDIAERLTPKFLELPHTTTTEAVCTVAGVFASNDPCALFVAMPAIDRVLCCLVGLGIIST